MRAGPATVSDAMAIAPEQGVCACLDMTPLSLARSARSPGSEAMCGKPGPPERGLCEGLRSIPARGVIGAVDRGVAWIAVKKRKRGKKKGKS